MHEYSKLTLKDIREPQYTDEEIENIITKHIKLNCPDYNDLTEEQFTVPYDAWQGIIEAFRNIASSSFKAALSEEIDHGEKKELINKYDLTWKGNEEGSNGWVGIYTDKEDNKYSIVINDRMGSDYGVLYRIGYLPYLKEN